METFLAWYPNTWLGKASLAVQSAIWLLLAGFLWIPYWYLVTAKYEGSFRAKLQDLSVPAKIGYVLLTLVIISSAISKPNQTRPEQGQLQPLADASAAMKDAQSKAKSISYSFGSEEMDRLFGLLVEQIKPGMTTGQVRNVLGQPHEIEKGGPVPQLQDTEIWTWRCKYDPDSFIMLSFKDDGLRAGGSTGYDINNGFKSRDSDHSQFLPPPADNTSAYQIGYSDGERIARDWVQKYRGMDSASQQVISAVYRNQIAAMEANRDRIVNAYGEPSDAAQQYIGRCDAVRAVCRTAGIVL